VSIVIRTIEVNDNIFLSNIIKSTFIEFNAPQKGTVFSDPTTDNLFEYFLVEKSICWVAEMNKIIVGCCGIYPTENLPNGYVELVKFYISNTARGKGIGKLLINYCINSAKEFGYTNIYLESLPHFSTAIKMYEKLGFIALQQPLGNSGHTSCDIWMTKKI
jgi:putative acetyltransferase